MMLGGAACSGLRLPAVRAQTAQRPRRVGILEAGADEELTRMRLTAFRQALEGMGWSEDRNIQFELRWGYADASRIDHHAAELVGLQPDVIVGQTAPVVAALLRRTRAVPIVFVSASDPVGAGFVESLARPGGNLTGFTNFEYAMGGKWLEILKEMAPGMARVAVVLNPDNPSAPGQLQAFAAPAAALGLTVVPAGVRHETDIRRVLDDLAQQPNGGLVVMPVVVNTVHRRSIIALAAERRLPAIYPWGYFARGGGLVSYGIELTDLYRRAASYVDRILRGEKPADLPIQAPTRFELIINLKTAKALGLTVPPMLLARADEVIE
jgi:putative ABC transport system substrate-binding protein